ncbi:membrane protein [Flammeovirgaceae bacterium 311]|nr:membrane protein [Flammeovirgaceae bacterium 311]
MQNHRLKIFLLSLYIAVFLWSVIEPKDMFIWMLEVAPAVMALAVLGLTYKSFPLTPLAYLLITLHACILFIGGHYTYAEVPLFDWIRDAFDGSRNNYDKLGHFAQGLVPAIIAREIFIRKAVVENRKWLAYFVITTCLGISAGYELLEWVVAEGTGASADAFLGTQGYAWDTQSDMLSATFGAAMALLLFSQMHDRQILYVQAQPGILYVSKRLDVTA